VTRGQLPQRAGSLGLSGCGAAAVVPPRVWYESGQGCCYKLDKQGIGHISIRQYCTTHVHLYNQHDRCMYWLTVEWLTQDDPSALSNWFIHCLHITQSSFHQPHVHSRETTIDHRTDTSQISSILSSSLLWAFCSTGLCDTLCEVTATFTVSHDLYVNHVPSCCFSLNISKCFHQLLPTAFPQHPSMYSTLSYNITVVIVTMQNTFLLKY